MKNRCENPRLFGIQMLALFPLSIMRPSSTSNRQISVKHLGHLNGYRISRYLFFLHNDHDCTTTNVHLK